MQLAKSWYSTRVRGGCCTGALNFGAGWYNLGKGDRGSIFPGGTEIEEVKKVLESGIGLRKIHWCCRSWGRVLLHPRKWQQDQCLWLTLHPQKWWWVRWRGWHWFWWLMSLCSQRWFCLRIEHPPRCGGAFLCDYCANRILWELGGFVSTQDGGNIWKYFFILSPLSIVGMFYFAGLLSIWMMLLIALLIAPRSV